MTPFLEPDRRLRSSGGGESEEHFGGRANTGRGGDGTVIIRSPRPQSGSNVFFVRSGRFFAHESAFIFDSAALGALLLSLECTRLGGAKKIKGKRKRQCLWQCNDTTLAGMSNREEREGASRQVRTELRRTIKKKKKKSLCPPPFLSLSSGRGISLTLHRVSLDFDKETTTTQRNAWQQGQARPKKLRKIRLYGHLVNTLPLFLINVVRGQGRSTHGRPPFGGRWFPSR